MKKQRWEESEKEKRREEERRSEKRTSQKKEDAGGRKGRKVANHCVFFQWFVTPEGRKVGSLKRLVRSHLARWEMKNRRSTPFSEHFWKLRCRKRTRRCGAKHISKSNCAKHLMSGALLEVEKVHAVVSTFPWVLKNRRSRTTWTFRCRFVWQAQGIFAPCQKWAKREGFLQF